MIGKKVIARVGTLTAVVALSAVGLASQAFAAPGVAPISEGSPNHHGVWCVQAAINQWAGRTVLSQDGEFGPQTREWVKKFQAGYGLAQDGVVGPKTGDDIWIFDGSSSYCHGYVPTSS
ncbi:peptidoglycan-binding domain-containing protein [Pseudonocardia acidicola]|uniref:Peptidoglycan-binding protein n=1 Tax=Pseudonocardia acidicola TaxID=2724939 RepID=A0ABX1S4H0_9PSEU|nr:peptidoglycan-binding domain-containing protein [Pseudonocardia acidicola]NMH96489.1 peptidoglycan-binding protein [Pseudonocardia acidicola]